MLLEPFVRGAATVMEGLGVASMVVGAVVAAVIAVGAARRGGRTAAFEAYRKGLGRGILLGLEFLVAADILRTVTADATIERVVILAVIVLIRTFLSFTLEVELDGRWPWQQRATDRQGAEASRRSEG